MTGPECLRAVVFDAVGTLITPEPDAVSIYYETGRAHGSRQSQAAIARLFGRAFRETGRAGETGGVEPNATSEAIEHAFWRTLVESVLSDLAGPAADACFNDLFAHFARPGAWRTYPDVGPALRELRRLGLTLAVASNFDSRLHAVAAGHAELVSLGRCFVSSEIGWRKPDRRFFAAVCDGLGMQPGEVLYVGDEPESDVAAAQAAGLNALWLNRSGPGGPDVLAALTQLPQRLRPTSGGPPA